jgi:hypothetical protein
MTDPEAPPPPPLPPSSPARPELSPEQIRILLRQDTGKGRPADDLHRTADNAQRFVRRYFIPGLMALAGIGIAFWSVRQIPVSVNVMNDSGATIYETVVAFGAQRQNLGRMEDGDVRIVHFSASSGALSLQYKVQTTTGIMRPRSTTMQEVATPGRAINLIIDAEGNVHTPTR